MPGSRVYYILFLNFEQNNKNILVFQYSFFRISVNIFFNSKIYGQKVLFVACVTKQKLDVNYTTNINRENINYVYVNYIVMKHVKV